MKTKVLIVLFLIGIISNAHAYDFSAVAPTGQTLYYNINGTNVTVTRPQTWYSILEPYGDLTIPENVTNSGITFTVTSIDHHALEGRSGLTSVTIPSSVTSIGNYAFGDCTGLTSVTIGTSVTSIGSYAFNNCSGLTSVTIPNSITMIGEYAFKGCDGLTTLNYNAINCTLTNPIFYHPLYQSNLTIINIGDSVTVIPSYFLYGCSNIDSVSLPNSVTRIGNNAFMNCTDLSSITLSSSLNVIGVNAFRGCSGLVSLTIPNSVDTIQGAAFCDCTGLVSINLPNSLLCLGYTVFSGCSSLVSKIIPNTITIINEATFYNCSSLTSVTIGNSVTTIGQVAFSGCSGLTEIRCLASIAPTINQNNTFIYASNSAVVKVPCGSLASYYSLWGSCFSNFTESASVLYAYSSDSIMGVVSVLSQPTSCQNPTATVLASANNGYHFLQWSNGITSNPYTLTLSSDSTLTAHFAHNQHNVLVQSSNENIGSVDGSGIYNEFDTATITAYPIDHYHFVRWSDGNTDNPRQFVVTGDATLTAYFAIDTHSVSVVSNDIARGMVNSTGTEFVYGTPCTVTATAYTGFEFIRWSNGVTANPYTFAVLGDVELTAIFVAPGEKTYTVTVSVNDPTMGTATVNGNASATMTSGTEVTLTATSNEGYRFVRWNDNNTNAVRTITVTSDMSFTATFEAMGSTEGIDEADGQTVVVYAAEGSIHIDAAQPAEASIYDMMGHRLATVTTGTSTPLPAGVYLVKVGTQPARKVVVIR